MIHCFSGTGNSRFVADKLKEMADNEDAFGLVFPVYAWGIPKVVEEFIDNELDRLNFSYIYAVMTCGDDMGYADHILRKRLKGRLDAAFSVLMPNTYVCLPGFDIDPDEVAEAKVKRTMAMLPKIAEAINARRHTTEVHRGSMPWLKTYVLRPLFNRFLVTDRYFSTTDACNRCHRCVKQCPLHNIDTDHTGSIHWGNTSCTGCLRCYHQCPMHAIRFGWFTKGTGQKKAIVEFNKNDDLQ